MIKPFCFLLVPKVGLEPTRYRYRRILSPLRLPFRHFGAGAKYNGLRRFPEPMPPNKVMAPHTGRQGTMPMCGQHADWAGIRGRLLFARLRAQG